MDSWMAVQISRRFNLTQNLKVAKLVFLDTMISLQDSQLLSTDAHRSCRRTNQKSCCREKTFLWTYYLHRTTLPFTKPEDIAKYKGRYKEGWHVLRKERFRDN